MQASSIAIIDAGVIPCIRIMARIIVLHMSAQFMHDGAQSIICVEHTVQACSHAAHASMHACAAAIIADMSVDMPSIDIMSADMASIIMASISHLFRVTADVESPSPSRRPACRHGRPRAAVATGADRLVSVMSHRIHNSPRTPFAAALAVLLGLALALVATPASAHDELIGSTPAADAQIDALPAELQLTFSGVLMDEPGATQLVVTDAAGTALAAGDPVLDGTRLTQPLAGSASGTVTVLWRVVSSDGHPVSGEFSFTVGDGSVAPTGTQTPLPGPPMEAVDMTWIWWVLGAVVVAGGILLVILLTRKRPSRED